MIINSKGLYYIDDKNIEKRAQSTYTFLSKFNEHEYYYIEFKGSLNKLADCLVEHDLLNKLINEAEEISKIIASIVLKAK
jgi:hypothetical protein